MLRRVLEGNGQTARALIRGLLLLLGELLHDLPAERMDLGDLFILEGLHPLLAL